MSLNQPYSSMGMGSHGSMYPGMHGGLMPSSLGMSGLDPYSGLGLGGGLGGLAGMGMGMGMGSMMMGGMPRSRRNPYYDSYGYGGGGGGSRGYGGGSPYELFDESMYDDDAYMDDYDDIEDPLVAFLRMQQRGGGRRGSRRGRRYYGGGGYGY
jgi:hypothetical protein